MSDSPEAQAEASRPAVDASGEATATEPAVDGSGGAVAEDTDVAPGAPSTDDVVAQQNQEEKKKQAKKKVKKKKKFRKKKKKKKKDESSDEEDDDTKVVLSDLVAEQKRRARRSGLGAGDLVKGPKKIVVEEVVEVKPEPKKNYGLQVQESKAEKVQKLDNLLGGTFTATTDREVTDDDNPFLQRYIEERMGKNKKGEEEKKELTDEQLLYKVPEDLKHTSNLAPDPEEDLGGAPMLHGTGIAEVALPMEFKIKCIEDTEKARKEYMARKQGWGDKRQKNRMLGNLTANFKQHQHNYVMKVKGKRPRDELEKHFNLQGGRSGGVRHKTMSHRQQTASDDAVVDRFRKRWRRR